VIEAFPTTTRWAIAGHSLGGVAAGNYINKHPDKIAAAAYWASYPIDDLSQSKIPMLSIWGDNDALVTPKLDKYWSKLPATIGKIVIAGGNHAQFGYYGIQSGDGTATIGRDVQQQQVNAQMQLLLEKM
jgi:pimeloyl-ACP methyl ester carboxylesterase